MSIHRGTVPRRGAERMTRKMAEVPIYFGFKIDIQHFKAKDVNGTCRNEN